MNMKSLYLFLAATAVTMVTCKPQHTNDIIWYPVENEEGVYISIYGEKHKMPTNSKYRSHRRARFSGMEPNWSYDPTENQDSSFFHNIHERRPSVNIPKFPTSLQNQRLPFNRPYERPQGQGNQNNNFQDILNEVFDNNNNNNNYPSVIEYPGFKPVFNNQWNNLPPYQNQWGGNPMFDNNNNNNNNQWNSPQWGRPTNAWQQRPNQWTSTTTPRPTQSSSSSSNNNNNNNRRPSTKRPNQSDKLIFPQENGESTTSTINLIPMETTTMSSCERLCPVTPEFNPVCGSDGVTYTNEGRLKCAQMCGKDVRLAHYRNCGRSPLVTPLISKNAWQRKTQPKFFDFW